MARHALEERKVSLRKKILNVLTCGRGSENSKKDRPVKKSTKSTRKATVYDSKRGSGSVFQPARNGETRTSSSRRSSDVQKVRPTVEPAWKSSAPGPTPVVMRSLNDSGSSGRFKKANSGAWSRSGSQRPQAGAAALGPANLSASRRSGSVRRSLSRLRDSYIDVMLKMADMSNQTGSGAAVMGSGPLMTESQLFESEVFRKRSQANDEMIDYCLQSSIQPDDWKEAQLANGGKLFKHSGSTRSGPLKLRSSSMSGPLKLRV